MNQKTIAQSLLVTFGPLEFQKFLHKAAIIFEKVFSWW